MPCEAHVTISFGHIAAQNKVKTHSLYVTTQNLCRLLLTFHKWENNFKSVETYKNPNLPFSVLK